MPHDSQPPNVDRTWQRLVAAARQAPPEALPKCDVDAIVAAVGSARTATSMSFAALPSSSGREAWDDDRRIVSWAALFAVAASLLLTFACWSEVSAMWSPPPIFDGSIDVGPTP